uniref:Uncharacterized protein n=1 Tax=Arundo donax TaxID=35708 RepID=A0A0A8YW40_ARUDO
MIQTCFSLLYFRHVYSLLTIIAHVLPLFS